MFKEDYEWALSKQPLAVEQHYSKIWQGAVILEPDAETSKICKALDIGGIDKIISFSDGRVDFLGQRFRRWQFHKHDDFTLRAERPSGFPTELQKLLNALGNRSFIAHYYAYGLINSSGNKFARFRILHLPLFAESLAKGELPYRLVPTKEGEKFWAISFAHIPEEFLFYDSTKLGKQTSMLQ